MDSVGLLALWFRPDRLSCCWFLWWQNERNCTCCSAVGSHVQQCMCKEKKNQLDLKAKPKILLPQHRVQPSGRKCVWQVTRVVWSYELLALCEQCPSYTQCRKLKAVSAQFWEMEKRIKSLHVQVVVFLLNSVIPPWLSLEICRKHFRGHRSMSLPNAEFFYELLRRLESLLCANWPVSMLVVFLELEDIFSMHK